MRQPPESRMRQEYGSVRAAMEWCIGLKLGVNATAAHLEVDRSVVRRWRDQLGLSFPARIDMHHACKGRNPGIAERNSRMFAGTHRTRGNTMVWYPGEPTWHYLQSVKGRTA